MYDVRCYKIGIVNGKTKYIINVLTVLQMKYKVEN